uniref:Uncharacterized protein n=1 Tax=uncultured marine virus TaxID=186617 RepID=A0A0F7L0N2_9VIRU|nr:hypothetical protein [uncultured marine virus]
MERFRARLGTQLPCARLMAQILWSDLRTQMTEQTLMRILFLETRWRNCQRTRS